MEERASLPPNIEHVYVYKSVREGPEDGELSALAVTKRGDVFGIGVNTIVGCSTYHSEYPMSAEGLQVLKKWTKVERLSGLGIRKIIVGSGFGAALVENELLTWGRGPVTSLGRRAVVTLQAYQPKSKCTICSNNHLFTECKIGGSTFSYCAGKNQIQILSNPTPHDHTARNFLKFNENDSIYCSQCTKQCSPTTAIPIPLYYCKDCDLLWEPDKTVGSLGLLRTGFFSSGIELDAGITDIAPYGWGIWLLMSNRLVWKGFVKLTMWEEQAARNPDNVRMRTVHWSNAGTFVTTDDGELYSCTGTTTHSESVLTLMKVPTQAEVVKVCSGHNATICLQADNSVWAVHQTNAPEYLLTIGQQVVDVVSLQGYDVFYIQTTGQVNFQTVDIKTCEDITIQLTSGGLDSNNFLLNLVCSLTHSNISTASQSTSNSMDSLHPAHYQQKSSAPKENIPSRLDEPSTALKQTAASLDLELLNSFLAGLYGQKSSSDITIKLSDGDFHAHRCVLMAMSPHFRESLTDTKPPVILDMSSANPEAYRCLLKHFYKQEVDDLDMDGLFELCHLADSYKETSLAVTTERKIRSKINESTVLHAFGMSKLHGCEDINTYCQELMRTPAIKDQLMQKVIENPLLILLFPH